MYVDFSYLKCQTTKTKTKRYLLQSTMPFYKPPGTQEKAPLKKVHKTTAAVSTV